MNKRNIIIPIVLVLMVFLIGFINKPKSNSLGDKSQVVVYNSHPFEVYKSGLSIKEASELLETKLLDNKLECTYIDNPNKDYKGSYEFSRKLILDNIKELNNTVLLDIHVNEDKETSNGDITVYVGKGNKQYTKNKQFAESLIKMINSVDNTIKCELILNGNGKYNQDLSSKALLISIGNKDTADTDMQNIIDALAASMGETL